MMCAEQEEKLLPFIHPKATTKFLYAQVFGKKKKNTLLFLWGDDDFKGGKIVWETEKFITK